MNKTSSDRSPIAANTISITVVYDNNPYQEGLLTSWGFACLIRGTQKTILFDTGANGSVLIENMKRIGIDPGEIDIVVLSHMHSDHTGGLEECLNMTKMVKIYFPDSFPRGFQSRLLKSGIKAIPVNDTKNLCTGVDSTGTIGTGIKEQSLVLDTDKGIILVTGCAHPGIMKILNTVREIITGDILLVMGGLHLAGLSRPELTEIPLYFRKAGVKHVAPCHCSGDLTRRLLKNEYGNNFMDMGVGRNIRFE